MHATGPRSYRVKHVNSRTRFIAVYFYLRTARSWRWPGTCTFNMKSRKDPENNYNMFVSQCLGVIHRLYVIKWKPQTFLCVMCVYAISRSRLCTNLTDWSVLSVAQLAGTIFMNDFATYVRAYYTEESSLFFLFLRFLLNNECVFRTRSATHVRVLSERLHKKCGNERKQTGFFSIRCVYA